MADWVKHSYTPGEKDAFVVVFRKIVLPRFFLSKFVFVFIVLNSNIHLLKNKLIKAHEYVTVDGKTGTVGITDFAQSALGDIVFVDLPEVGEEFEKGEGYVSKAR